MFKIWWDNAAPPWFKRSALAALYAAQVAAIVGFITLLVWLSYLGWGRQ